MTKTQRSCKLEDGFAYIANSKKLKEKRDIKSLLTMLLSMKRNHCIKRRRFIYCVNTAL